MKFGHLVIGPAGSGKVCIYESKCAKKSKSAFAGLGSVMIP